MEPFPTTGSRDADDLLRRALAGDEEALAPLYAHYRERLRQMVRLRLDRRLLGRLDPAAVLEEASRDFARRFPEYIANPSVPFYLWLRSLTGAKLVDLHRRHLGATMPDAGREVSLYRGALPPASSRTLAAQFLGRSTSADDTSARAETQVRVQEALNRLAPLDREVLTLRHFEMLTPEETAQVLGLEKTAAGKRYLLALRQFKEVLAGLPDVRQVGNLPGGQNQSPGAGT
jgi:RNA polymerase sigma-70 factor (ECF subfamily)